MEGHLCRILVIEDDDANRFLFQQVLLMAGFEVINAVCGMDGVRLAQSCHPAVILLDIGLPDMSGLDVLPLLRNHQATKDIPVVAVTAYASGEDENRFTAAGFNAYISKPVDIAIFGRQLKEVIANHRIAKPHSS